MRRGALYIVDKQEQKASPSGAGACPDVPTPEGESTDGEASPSGGGVFMSETESEGLPIDQPTLEERVDNTLAILRAPLSVSLPSPITIDSSNENDPASPDPVHKNQPPSSVQSPLQRTSESLEQWRQIRHEQDIAFQESLQADREKARRQAALERRKQVTT